MPDALPPVGVLLATLDAATLPLAGTELTFVMQGGQPRRTPVSSIGGSVYARSGTYTPTVTASGTATASTVGAGGPGPLGYSRVGSGAGVPSIGDTIVAFGGVLCESLVDGDTVDVSLPFQLGLAVLPRIECSLVVPGDLVVSAELTSATSLRFTFAVTATDGATVSFSITFQTANAVDP